MPRKRPPHTAASPPIHDEPVGPSTPRLSPDRSSASAASQSTVDDHDSPWKEALEQFFPQALALLTPELYAAIDWSLPVVFLEKELQSLQCAGNHGRGRRYADKLVRVHLKDDGLALLLIHVEVQGRLSGPKALRAFARRMMEYRFLIRVSASAQADTQGSCALGSREARAPWIYSIGILVDQAPRAQGEPPLTQGDHEEHLGQCLHFSFPVVSLNQWRDRGDELDALAHHNPFAVLVMAQLQANAHRDKTTRLAPLLGLVGKLYDYGYPRDQIAKLLRLVEWMVRLPPALETDYRLAVQQLDQEHAMSYVTIAERHGIAIGREEGRTQGQADLLLRQLTRRFGPLPDDTTQRVRSANTAQLETWSLNILDATTLQDVFRE